MGTEGENTTSSPWSVTVRPLPEGAFSRRGGKGRDGGDLGGGQRSGRGMVKGDGKGLAGRQANSTGVGLGGGRTSRRRMTNIF